MIIQINEKNQIIAAFDETLVSPDNKSTFAVANFHGFKKGLIPYYNTETKKVEYKPTNITPAKKIELHEKIMQKKIAATTKEKALQWLADNDWKVNKRTVGEWAEDDPRWLEYLAGRAKARAQYDKAVAILNQK